MCLSAFLGPSSQIPKPHRILSFPQVQTWPLCLEFLITMPPSPPGKLLLILQDSEQTRLHLRRAHTLSIIALIKISLFAYISVSSVSAVLLKLRLIGCEVNFLCYHQNFLKMK